MKVKNTNIKKYSISLVAALLIFATIPASAKTAQSSQPIKVGKNTEITICNGNTGKVYYSYSDQTENKEESLQQLREYGLIIE